MNLLIDTHNKRITIKMKTKNKTVAIFPVNTHLILLAAALTVMPAFAGRAPAEDLHR